MAPTSAMTRWSQIVSDLENSGLSARDYAHANGVNASTLAWWRWRLRKDARSATVSAFVQVEMPVHASHTAIRVVLQRRDVVLEVEDGVDVGRVRELVDALC